VISEVGRLLWQRSSRQLTVGVMGPGFRQDDGEVGRIRLNPRTSSILARLAARRTAVLKCSVLPRKFTMPTGKVKWFDTKKGYGFIIPDDGGRDLFVHITAVQKAGYTDLVPGVRVSYEIKPDREGNPTAESLRFGIPPPGF
jgi:cold shock protein